VLNVTVLPVRTPGYLALWTYGLTPLVFTLNALDGSTSNMAIAPVNNESSTLYAHDPVFTAYVTASTDLIVDMTGYFAR
jgi:hypothetical protein